MTKIFIFFLLGLVLLGCAENTTLTRGEELANRKFYQERSPQRVKTHLLENGAYTFEYVWAGVKGSSVLGVVDEVLKRDVHQLIKSRCDFDKSDLQETYIVEHKHPFFYEVWVYHDPKSKRKDKTTGLSLILEFPTTGGTDINIVSHCTKG